MICQLNDRIIFERTDECYLSADIVVFEKLAGRERKQMRDRERDIRFDSWHGRSLYLQKQRRKELSTTRVAGDMNASKYQLLIPMSTPHIGNSFNTSAKVLETSPVAYPQRGLNVRHCNRTFREAGDSLFLDETRRFRYARKIKQHRQIFPPSVIHLSSYLVAQSFVHPSAFIQSTLLCTPSSKPTRGVNPSVLTAFVQSTRIGMNM